MSSSVPADQIDSQSAMSHATAGRDRPALKPKKCRVCRKVFTPQRPLQACCSPNCAIVYAKLSGEKRQSVAMKRVAMAEKREAKERLRSRRDWVKLAQSAFNAFIRERDSIMPCISCHMPMTYGGQWHAGHYRTTAAAPQLRFDEANVHRQCAQCNSSKSGNVVEYRKKLVERIGVAEVERLENDNRIYRATVGELKAVIVKYRDKLREMRKVRAG